MCKGHFHTKKSWDYFSKEITRDMKPRVQHIQIDECVLVPREDQLWNMYIDDAVYMNRSIASNLP
jgi:hypothetical protein